MFEAHRLDAIDEHLQLLVDALSEVQVQDSPSVWKRFDHIERVAANVKLMLAGKVDRSAQWRKEGHRSVADYLAAEGGSTAAEARRDLEACEKVSACPATADAMGVGKVSRRQALPVLDAATANPAAERQLLKLAETESLSGLEHECSRVKAAADPDPEATARAIHRRRSWSTGTSIDGGAWGKVYGRRQDIGFIDAVLAPMVDKLFNQARREGRNEPRDAYAYDALMSLIRQGSGIQASDSKQAKQQPVRSMMILRADLPALINGEIGEGEVCEVDGYGPVSVSVMREMLGESILKLVLTKGAAVRNVTHLGHGVTAAQQVALLWERQLCERLGCPRRHRLENDHRYGYRETKRTRVDEIDRLCEHDHDLKTYKGWALVEGTGPRPMVPPDHPDHPRNKASPRDARAG